MTTSACHWHSTAPDGRYFRVPSGPLPGAFPAPSGRFPGTSGRLPGAVAYSSGMVRLKRVNSLPRADSLDRATPAVATAWPLRPSHPPLPTAPPRRYAPVPALPPGRRDRAPPPVSDSKLAPTISASPPAIRPRLRQPPRLAGENGHIRRSGSQDRPLACESNQFNYAVYFPTDGGTWVWMNIGFDPEQQVPQVVLLGTEPPKYGEGTAFFVVRIPKK